MKKPYMECSRINYRAFAFNLIRQIIMIEEIKIIPIKLKKEQINRYSNIKIYGESLSLDKLKKKMKEYRI